MLLVLILAAGLWGLGAAMGVPRRNRWATIGVLYIGVVLGQILLPDGHALRAATGGSPGLWLLLGGFAVLALAYARLLRWLRVRATPAEAATAPKVASPGSFADGELERYARHIVLRELGGPGQKRLKQAKVLVIGAGGLGSPALLYLATSGVGTIGVIDGDVVDSSNLQRQVAHREEDIGTPKVFSAARAMSARNPFVEIKPYHRELTEEIAEDLFAEYDLVLDGTDNFDTRYLVNRAAVATGIPLVSGALS